MRFKRSLIRTLVGVLASVVVAVLALAGAGYLPNRAVATTAAGDCSPGAEWGTVRSELASQAIDLVNAHRRSLGLRQLSVSRTLEASAVWKARHMARYSYMAHSDPAPPVGRSTGERMAACGYGASWGENIAYGYPSAQSVVNGWLGSPGHRANIENPNWTAIGSGAAASASGTVYWAHAFGSAATGSPPPPPPPPPPPSPPPPSPPPPPTTKASGSPAAPSRPSRPRRPRTPSASGAVVLHGLELTPRRPKAGRTMTSTVAAFRRGDRIGGGKVSCYARLDGRPLEIVERRFRAGLATCTWRLPTTGRGKLASAVVVVGQGPKRVRAPFRSWIS